VAGVAASAQYGGSIQGIVTDPQGGVVSGATLTLRDAETAKIFVATSDVKGVFSFNGLLPGRYSVVVEKAGFEREEFTNVNVIADQPNGLNVQLKLGTATETVKVDASKLPPIDTESGSISGTVTEEEIQKLPSTGRDVFQLAQLALGSFGDGAQTAAGTHNLPYTEGGADGSTATSSIFGTANGAQIITDGTRQGQNNYTIDGVGVTDVNYGGASVITPSEESVKEIKIISNNYDAEYGRWAGGQVQVTSANGTNDFHGSAFFKVDRPGLNAYAKWGGTFGLPQRNNADFNQIGGSLGGPIWKNRIFFFFSYETLRSSAKQTGSGWIETPQLLQLAPSGSIASKFTSYPGTAVLSTSIDDVPCSAIGLTQGVNCNMIPGKGINVGSPLTTPLGTADPSYVSSLNPGIGSGLSNVPDLMYANFVLPSNITDEQYHGRIDFNVTAQDLVAFSMYWVPVTTSSINGPARESNEYNHDQVNEAATVLWDHTFSPTFINQARLNAAGYRWNEINDNPQEPWGLPQDYIDQIGSAGNNQNFFGAPGPSIADEWTYSAKDTLTKVLNRHTIKFGGEYTRLLNVVSQVSSARPSYYFHNYWDFLNDAPYRETGVFDHTSGIPTSFRKDPRQDITALFIQDTYKVRPNFTLTLGLRWEYFGPLSDKNGNLGVVRLGSTEDTLLTGMSIRKGGDLYNASLANFGPQVGFAWSPSRLGGHEFNSKLVLRGGFGIAYSGIEENMLDKGDHNPPFVSSNSNLSGSQILYGLPSGIHSFYGYPANPYTVTGFNSNLLPTSSIVGVVGYPSSMPTTYTEHYSFEGNYDFGHQLIGTLGYQGSSSRHLLWSTNLNLLYSQNISLNPAVNSVQWYSNSANADFNALVAQAQYQLARSLQLTSQYRYSVCMDDASGNNAVPFYPWLSQSSWGHCDYDVRRAFKTFGVWSPRIFKGDDWKEKVIGGWSLSGIFNWHTGFPWSPTYSTIDNQSVFNMIYQNGGLLGGSPGLFGLLPASYLGGAGSDYSNATFMRKGGNFPNGGAAYFTAPSFTPGPAFPNVGPLPGAPGVARNSFQGPGYRDVDATLSKSFRLPANRLLGENSRFEFRANFYNLFNTLNLNEVDTTVTDTYFGTSEGALAGRSIELQARIVF
jgi:hypothetical protein